MNSNYVGLFNERQLKAQTVEELETILVAMKAMEHVVTTAEMEMIERVLAEKKRLDSLAPVTSGGGDG